MSNNNENRPTPELWIAVIATAITAIITSAQTRSFDEFMRPENLLIVFAVTVLVYSATRLVFHFLEWWFIYIPAKGTGHQTGQHPAVFEHQEPAEEAAVDPTPEASRFEKRFFISEGKMDDTARFRLGNKVVEITWDQVDWLSDIFDQRASGKGKLPHISGRKISEVTDLDRLSKDTTELIYLLEDNGVVKKRGNKYEWTAIGKKQFPPALTQHNRTPLVQAGTPVRTSSNQPRPVATNVNQLQTH